MRSPNFITAGVVVLLLSRTAIAAEVKLPAPVLEWSFYILLIFAACVAVGIFWLSTGKKVQDEPLSSLLNEQNQTIHSVRPDVSVTACINQMNEHNIGAMLVMDNDQLLGIFTERDAITRVLGAGLDPAGTDVSSVMTKNPTCVTNETTLDEAMGIVTRQRIRHLPVVENDKLLGMVSSGDLTHRLVQDQAGDLRRLVDAGRKRRSR